MKVNVKTVRMFDRFPGVILVKRADDSLLSADSLLRALGPMQ